MQGLTNAPLQVVLFWFTKTNTNISKALFELLLEHWNPQKYVKKDGAVLVLCLEY